MQHYQRNVTAVLAFCPVCNKKTLHQVHDRRVGSCLEVHGAGMTLKQKKLAEQKAFEAENPSLF